MRKLASIQTVNAVEPISNADAIEKIRVLGWWIVSKKGEHKPGDRVLYCEIDSLLPERPEFEFLRSSSFKPAQTDPVSGATIPAGFRIKTVKLRGQVSQGICFPLSILPPGAPDEEGADVTDLLGIRKWEPPAPVGMGGKVKGGFPGFLPKTDETRVQVLEGALQRHKGKTFYVTEKLDGTSFTAFLRQGEFGICSRNLWMDEADESNVLARVAKGLRIDEKLRTAREKLGHDVAIQAEVIGPGIQKNKYALKEVSLRVFNVFNVDAYRLVDHAVKLVTLAEMGLEPVPQLGTLVLNHTVDELVAFAEGTSVLNPQVQREGVVLRPLVEEYDEDIGGRLSFKAINPKFLLKYDE
ncbi:RNA ligase (ATP) [Gemmata obscuriglobus]|uniref:RNA ligase (ATP) n=1 Tax=Gemmata obscuriglobus TaxID=114 RepID=A0A2Z3GTH3_9BACT|nr:RNA ligase (ATP) [Gemmata obscuriglobus]AWM37073.1 RNA ligase (ATP) [Gemmata obscuriglobus]